MLVNVLEKMISGPLSEKNYRHHSINDIKKIVNDELTSFAEGEGYGTAEQLLALKLNSRVQKRKTVQDTLIDVSQQYLTLSGMGV